MTSNETLATRQRVGLAIGAIIAIIALIVLVIPLLPGVNVGAAEGQMKVQPSATPTPTPSDSCDPRFVQVAVGNEGSKVDDQFEAKYIAATAEANNLSDAQRDLILEWSGKNAELLAEWSYGFGLNPDPNNGATFIEDGCLSHEGQMLYAKLEGALTAAGTQFAEADAPAHYYNTGVNDGVFGVAEHQGISGNRKAIKITLNAGTDKETVVWIMIRCGNLALPSKPPIPTVPTDQPRCPHNPALPPDSEDCKPPVERKKPEESTLNNPAVDDWKKDGGEKHSVSNGDGSKVANGYQADPQGDAEKAAEQAQQENEQAQQEHQEEIADDVVVEEDQDLGPLPEPSTPPAGW